MKEILHNFMIFYLVAVCVVAYFASCVFFGFKIIESKKIYVKIIYAHLALIPFSLGLVLYNYWLQHIF